MILLQKTKLERLSTIVGNRFNILHGIIVFLVYRQLYIAPEPSRIHGSKQSQGHHDHRSGHTLAEQHRQGRHHQAGSGEHIRRTGGG